MQWNEMTQVNEYKYWIHPMKIQTQSNAMQRNVMQCNEFKWNSMSRELHVDHVDHEKKRESKTWKSRKGN